MVMSVADCAEDRPLLKQATTRERKRMIAEGNVRRFSGRRKRVRTWKDKKVRHPSTGLIQILMIVAKITRIHNSKTLTKESADRLGCAEAVCAAASI